MILWAKLSTCQISPEDCSLPGSFLPNRCWPGSDQILVLLLPDREFEKWTNYIETCFWLELISFIKSHHWGATVLLSFCTENNGPDKEYNGSKQIILLSPILGSNQTGCSKTALQKHKSLFWACKICKYSSSGLLPWPGFHILRAEFSLIQSVGFDVVFSQSSRRAELSYRDELFHWQCLASPSEAGYCRDSLHINQKYYCGS